MGDLRHYSFVAALAAGAMAATSLAARADDAGDPNAVDVLGFHLGMTSDEVKTVAATAIQSPVLDIKQGSLSLGNFKTDQMVFGVEVSSVRDTQSGHRPNEEYLHFVFSQQAPYPTLYIARDRVFDQSSAPDINQTINSLAEKYGPPAGEEDYGQDKNYYWTYNSEVKFKPHDPYDSCSGAIFETAFAGNLFSGSFLSNPDPSYARCGTWMRITVGPLQSNPQLVGRISINLGDLKAMRESDLFTFGLLTSGAHQADGDQDAQAKKRKMHL